MQIRVGFEMEYQCRGPTPMMLALSIHYSRASDLVRPDLLVTSPAVPVTAYRDLFGNWCSRLVAPPGRFVLSTDALVNDSGLPDVVAPQAMQTPVEQLPESTLVYLLAAAIARRISCPTSRGGTSAPARPVGRGCRRSATSSTGTSSSATRMRATHARRWRLTGRGAVCAATMPTWPSRCAAA